MSWQIHLPNFKSISQKRAEKSSEKWSVTDWLTDIQTGSKLRVPRHAGRGLEMLKWGKSSKQPNPPYGACGDSEMWVILLIFTIYNYMYLKLKCYKNEHSFEICHWAWSSKLSCKISRRYDQQLSRKWHLKLLFWVFFRIFPNGNCHFLPGLWKAGCDVARLYVLQSYRSCTFCKPKTRGETQFWIEFAAPYTLANNNEIYSDDRLPFIIFFTSNSCDGSNRLWRQRLLPSPCSLWHHKQTLVGVIRSVAGGKCRTFRRVTEWYRFHRYLCFHCIFCVRTFLYIVLYEQSDHIVLKLYPF